MTTGDFFNFVLFNNNLCSLLLRTFSGMLKSLWIIFPSLTVTDRLRSPRRQNKTFLIQQKFILSNYHTSDSRRYTFSGSSTTLTQNYPELSSYVSPRCKTSEVSFCTSNQVEFRQLQELLTKQNLTEIRKRVVLTRHVCLSAPVKSRNEC